MDSIFILLELMFVAVFSIILQQKFKVPTPISLLVCVSAAVSFDFVNFSITSHQFDTLVLLTLPLLIMADSLKLNAAELKENWFGLFWVAVISVAISVLFGTWAGLRLFDSDNIPIAGLVMLFCMISATDPITLSAVFSNFKVPHKLKFWAEGESLFNDATALIIFSLALLTLTSNAEITGVFILSKSFLVIGGAVLLGAVIGALTYATLKLSDNPLVEAAILIFGAYLSYAAAEHYHFSGILSVIVSMVIANMWIIKAIHANNCVIETMFDKIQRGMSIDINVLTYSATSKENHKSILANIDFLAMFASTALFASMASLVDLALLSKYWKEIIGIFILSTVIRGAMMLKFAMINNKFTNAKTINIKWWSVLTFAGSKGALSILMVHMIPDSFEFKKLFEQVVIGNILLSTIVYGLILAGIISYFKKDFELECEHDH